MARNQQKADELATYYKITQQRIIKLKEEKEKLTEMWTKEKDPEIRFRIRQTAYRIRCNEKDLNRFAHLIVKYLYGDEEEQDA